MRLHKGRNPFSADYCLGPTLTQEAWQSSEDEEKRRVIVFLFIPLP